MQELLQYNNEKKKQTHNTVKTHNKSQTLITKQPKSQNTKTPRQPTLQQIEEIKTNLQAMIK